MNTNLGGLTNNEHVASDRVVRDRQMTGSISRQVIDDRDRRQDRSMPGCR